MKERSLPERVRDRVDEVAEKSPARLSISVFVAIIVLFTALLQLPIATTSTNRAPFTDALFTATSAVCVTGLTTVDTATYWSPFGQAIIALGIMIGGMGVMTLASILAFAVSRHIGLTQRMLTASETKTQRLGEVGALVRAVIVTSLIVEAALALVFFPRFVTLGDEALPALWHAIFMSISVFNNAGFVVLPHGLEPHVADWWFNLPIILGTVLGAIGFPVLLNVARRWRTPRKWTLHTKLTLTTYGLLSLLAFVAIPVLEWNNPATFGALDGSGKAVAALLFSVNSRTLGLATIDVADFNSSTWFLQDALMFIGGGTASTAGGIKVTTFAVLLLAIVAEARGDRDIEVFSRRIPNDTVRLSVAVAFIGATLVGIAALLLILITGESLDVVLFETISAFATVGLSTGLTPTLPEHGKLVLIALMFAGRLGTMTVAAALALRSNLRVVRMPEERPSIG